MGSLSPGSRRHHLPTANCPSHWSRSVAHPTSQSRIMLARACQASPFFWYGVPFYTHCVAPHCRAETLPLLSNVIPRVFVEARELDVGSTGQGWKTRVELSWIGRAMVKEDLRNKTIARTDTYHNEKLFDSMSIIHPRSVPVYQPMFPSTRFSPAAHASLSSIYIPYTNTAPIIPHLPLLSHEIAPLFLTRILPRILYLFSCPPLQRLSPFPHILYMNPCTSCLRCTGTGNPIKVFPGFHPSGAGMLR
ncbi:hypothetical protein B0J15DRAFT_118627 [Fusarium solani]|uniref:Uncharacterized protein n=1 Tax=Fusarium solani TaxID=169388 RepID=A0A9P9L523_FUSSL|nr:uncharacterized protein B0J15DRAFT_118627 [Fusarium solani]KAH7274070.1 hypothetical protein B0J15DRAFT_118627 [Fusarium solani]